MEPVAEEAKVVLFPYGSDKGYFFRESTAEGIDRLFPQARIDVRYYGRYVHWHYNRNGPSLKYLRGLNPEGKCERVHTNNGHAEI